MAFKYNLIKIFFIVIFCFGLLHNCSNKEKNNGIIDESTFIDVLVDIHIADATLIVKGFRINTDSTSIKLFYNDVLIKHNVTQKQIQNTFRYYSKKPRKFEKLYKKVSEKIVIREGEYEESVTEENVLEK